MMLNYFADSLSTFWPDVGLFVIGFVGVVGVLGAISAYFYKGRADALIDLQEKQIKVLKDNKEALEKQNEQLLEERKSFIDEQNRMRSELKTLKGLYSPKQLNDLAKTLANQHTDVMRKLTAIAEGLVSDKEQ